MMKKRFTEFKPYRQGESKGRYVQYAVTGCYNDSDRKGDYTTGASVDRLAELEDKIEQGTLIELPCKVGDTVWELDLFSKSKIREIKARNLLQIFHWIDDESFGKFLFLTREEAEKKLKELQECLKR